MKRLTFVMNFILLFAGAYAGQNEKLINRPNIVLIQADDLGIHLIRKSN